MYVHLYKVEFFKFISYCYIVAGGGGVCSFVLTPLLPDSYISWLALPKAGLVTTLLGVIMGGTHHITSYSNLLPQDTMEYQSPRLRLKTSPLSNYP
jgi:hypothetical protein